MKWLGGNLRRLQGFDYSQPGSYFVTICTQDREQRFGLMQEHVLVLSEVGEMVGREWEQLPGRFGCVVLDEYIVMPDHFHGIVRICPREDVVGSHISESQVIESSSSEDVGSRPTSTLTLFEIVGAFKSITTNQYSRGVQEGRWSPFRKRLWQNRFYDRVIRDEGELERIRKYIIENPIRL